MEVKKLTQTTSFFVEGLSPLLEEGVGIAQIDIANDSSRIIVSFGCVQFGAHPDDAELRSWSAFGSNTLIISNAEKTTSPNYMSFALNIREDDFRALCEHPVITRNIAIKSV